MASASNKQIPKSFRANRSKFLQWLGRTVLNLFGWKVKGGIEEKHDDKKLVVLIAPHTSNWDFINWYPSSLSTALISSTAFSSAWFEKLGSFSTSDNNPLLTVMIILRTRRMTLLPLHRNLPCHLAFQLLFL